MDEKITKLKAFKESENGTVFFYILIGFVIGLLAGTLLGRISRCEGISILSNNGSGNRDNGSNNSEK
ncbi:MAG: hypothetical protein ACI4JF_11300 [Oscillospiraceae bacterium]